MQVSSHCASVSDGTPERLCGVTQRWWRCGAPRCATRYRFKTVSCSGRYRSTLKRLPPNARFFHHSRLPSASTIPLWISLPESRPAPTIPLWISLPESPPAHTNCPELSHTCRRRGSPHGAAWGRAVGAFEPQSNSVSIQKVGAASIVGRR